MNITKSRFFEKDWYIGKFLQICIRELQQEKDSIKIKIFITEEIKTIR